MSENLQFAIVTFLMLNVMTGLLLYWAEKPCWEAITGIWVWEDAPMSIMVFETQDEAAEHQAVVGAGIVYFVEFGSDWVWEDTLMDR